ncbi:MAG: helix-turn-helix domain-containing protein [Nocardiopsaceae bacterium]|nr:helix-turn-helix domain-containing protein [Nocardiopsaceae bacterium]
MEEDRITPLLESAHGEAPLAALYATVRLRTEVERLEAIHVRRARMQGATWAEIATVLGISKQAVHKKYGGARREK